jgi:hypothetical protein
MDLKGLFNKGKKMVDERGGVESLKEDAQELAGIAKEKGSLADKAKDAAEALKDPGTNQPAGQQHHPNRDATEARHADADRQHAKERRHP